MESEENSKQYYIECSNAIQIRRQKNPAGLDLFDIWVCDITYEDSQEVDRLLVDANQAVHLRRQNAFLLKDRNELREAGLVLVKEIHRLQGLVDDPSSIVAAIKRVEEKEERQDNDNPRKF